MNCAIVKAVFDKISGELPRLKDAIADKKRVLPNLKNSADEAGCKDSRQKRRDCKSSSYMQSQRKKQMMKFQNH